MADLSALEDILKVKFKNNQLLEEALIHRSFLNENHEITASNERLEFLGDSVLSLVVSTELFHRFPDYPEGKLTSLRSLLVKSKTLGSVANKLHFGDFLLMSRGEQHSGGRTNRSLLADTFEAILGAIYLDQGLQTVRLFLEANLFPLIPKVEKQEDLQDYKSLLQERTQYQVKISPAYKVVAESGPDHDKIFRVGVFLDNTLLASGEGKSKQIAEQAAAKAALEKHAKKM